MQTTNTTTETPDDRGLRQARAQLDSVREYVRRLKHAEECTDGGCQEGEGGGDYWSNGDEYHDQDAAREAIEQDALSVEIRSDWHTPGDTGRATASEYRILLCTGGPACQITGELNEHGEPETAEIQGQDWGTPWQSIPTTEEEGEDLLTYARCFYFGE